MKIDRVSSAAATPKRRSDRAGRSKSAGFSKMLGTGDASGAGPVSGAGALGQVDALLSLQEVGNETDANRQGQRRGQELLDRLDELRLALLTGRLSVAVVERLANLVAARRAHVRDPRLAEILADIELRAAVELAKLGR